MTNSRTARTARDKAAGFRAEVARREARRRSLIALSAVTAVILIIVGVFVLVQNSKRDTATASTASPAGFSADGSITVGQAGAPVTLTAYEDFQCPACLSFEQDNETQLKTWIANGTVKVTYHPISFLDRASTTGYSTRALNAAAAVVSSSPARFTAFHDALYANQPAEGSAGLTDQKLIGLAVAAGAPKAAVTTAINDQTYRSWTVRVTDAASKAGVNSTPTLLVNGTKLTSYAPDVVKQAVDAAAAKAK